MELIDKIKRGLKKPPKIIFARVLDEIRKILGQFSAPIKVKLLTEKKLLHLTEKNSLIDLWNRLAAQQYPVEVTSFFNADEYNQICPDDFPRIICAAEKSLSKNINLLGTGWISLGEKIDWHKDYKTNIRWEPKYISKIKYSTPNNRSDVKIPWEISRLQWLIPVGQAYILTKDEKYAHFVKEVVTDWIIENPYAQSVNWACTMEAAMRIFTFTWFFKIFNLSKSWQDDSFRFMFLKNLYLHGDFTEKYIERSDVNGNHFTADAAALVMAGLFFHNGKNPTRWAETGWKYLEDEIEKQVYPDGVNYEASVPYHRLVTELFFYPAYYRQQLNLPISDSYLQRLKAMAKYVVAYSRKDGSSPLWGDADDARTLPFKNNALNDHRYLIGMVGIAFNDDFLLTHFNGSKEELFWLFGEDKIKSIVNSDLEIGSIAFKDGGFYIMRDTKNHIFIDCGPIGLAGRGGHGHNDLLSFEAVLDNEHIITDSGQYLYTSDYAERNNFRSTAYHNTPQIEDEEINRFIRWDYLWNLHNDAQHNVIKWESNSQRTYFQGSHNGYERLKNVVKINRSFSLQHDKSELIITDTIISRDTCNISIPFFLTTSSKIVETKDNEVLLSNNNKLFLLTCKSKDKFEIIILNARISKSYGTYQDSKKIVFKSQIKKNMNCIFILRPTK